MNVELKVSEQTQRRLLVTVDKETFEKDYQKAQKKFIKEVEVPGFRKGKAPIQTVLRMYEADIKTSYLDTYANTYYQYGMNESKARAISQPNFVDCIFEESGEITFIFEFESYPAGFSFEYKGLKVKFKEIEYSDDMLETTIKNLLLDNSEEVPFTETDELQHYDKVKLLNLSTQEELEDFYIDRDELEKVGFIEDDLTGLKINDTFSTETIEYKVIDAFHRIIPELNDETAKVLGHDTVEIMRVALKDEILKGIIDKNEINLINAVIEAFGLHNKDNIKIPRNLFLEAGHRILYQYFGGRSDEIDKLPEDFIVNLGERDRAYIIWDLVYDKISAENDLSVMQEDIDKEIDKIAAYYNTTSEALIAKQTNIIERVKDDLLSKKVATFIMQFGETIEPDEPTDGIDDDMDDAEFEVIDS